MDFEILAIIVFINIHSIVATIMAKQKRQRAKSSAVFLYLNN